ncbi:MAG: hypothetical protein WBD55_10310 [Dehalococcoidia bacterium]
MSGLLTILNVGQGDAIILHNRETATAAVIDCAMPGASLATHYLRDADVQHVAGVVVTHLDDDHYGGVPQLLRDMKPRPELVAYGVAKGYRAAHQQVDTFFTQMYSYEQRYGCRYVQPVQGASIGSPEHGVHLEFLGPNDDEERRAVRYNNANFASAIIRVSVGDLTAIVPGDAPPWRWDRLRVGAPDLLRADVLLLPHHGAAHVDEHVSLETLLDLVQPRVICISVGSSNRYGHPRAATLDVAGAWAATHDARLVCTQLNCACSEGTGPNGRLAPGTACGGHLTVEHDGTAVSVRTEASDHMAFVAAQTAPRCALRVATAA